MPRPCHPLFERVVALGDSVSQGAQNVGVSVRSQVHGVPAMLCRQAGADLPLPLLAAPGYPPHVDQLGVVLRSRVTHPEWLRGVRLNPTVRPRNLAVAGVRLGDVVGLTCANMARLRRTRAIQRLTRLALNPEGLPADEHLSQLDRAVAERPSLVILWAGGNDAIEALFYPAKGVTPLAAFARQWRHGVERLLAETDATVLAISVPDVTLLPMLQAWGRRPRLLSLMRETFAEYNDVVRASRSYGDRVMVADIGPGISRYHREGLSTAGWDLPYRVRRGALTFDALTGLPGLIWSGGLVSFDGLHPTTTGYALLTNLVIEALAQEYGVVVPPVDLAATARRDALLRRPTPYSWAMLRGYLSHNYSAEVDAAERQTWPIELRRGRFAR